MQEIEVYVRPRNLRVEALIPSVMIFGRGAFGKEVGLDEVIMIEPHDETVAFIRSRSLEPSVISPLQGEAGAGARNNLDLSLIIYTKINSNGP